MMMHKILYVLFVVCTLTVYSLVVSYNRVTECKCEPCITLANTTTIATNTHFNPPPLSSSSSPTCPPPPPPLTCPTPPPCLIPDPPPTCPVCPAPVKQTTPTTPTCQTLYAPVNNSRIMQRHPPNRSNTSGLIILGMHRSGTSMITGAISTCLGIPTSTPEMNYTMMAGTKENQKGYFERLDAVHLSVFMLGQVKLSVDGFTTNSLSCLQTQHDKGSHSAVMRKPIMNAIFDDLTQYDTWIIKDPRMALTYGYFHPYVNNPVFIIPVRNPLEVAKSLVARSVRTSPKAMLDVWENYIYNSLRYSMGQRRIFLFHNEFIRSVNTSLSQVYAELKAMGVSLPGRTKAEINHCSAQWVDLKLVHHNIQETLSIAEPIRVGRETLQPTVLQKYFTLYQQLKSGIAQKWTLNELPPNYRSHPYNCTEPPPKKKP